MRFQSVTSFGPPASVTRDMSVDGIVCGFWVGSEPFTCSIEIRLEYLRMKATAASWSYLRPSSSQWTSISNVTSEGSVLRITTSRAGTVSLTPSPLTSYWSLVENSLSWLWPYTHRPLARALAPSSLRTLPMFTAPSTVSMLVPLGQPPEPTYLRPSACAWARRASHVPVSTAPWSATACIP